MPNLRNCAWIKRHIMTRRLVYGGALKTTAEHMIRELGSNNHKDHLAVFLASSNRMKGTLSSLKTVLNNNKFSKMTAGEEQLLYVQEFGMIFSYWNLPEIWGSCCVSYNGIYSVLQAFDADWALNNPHDPLQLSLQWRAFVLTELSNVVMNAKIQAMSMYNSKKSKGGIWGWWWDLKWWSVYQAPLVNY